MNNEFWSRSRGALPLLTGCSCVSPLVASNQAVCSTLWHDEHMTMRVGAASPVTFDPSHPNLSALTWEPTTAEIQSQLPQGMTGPELEDGVVHAAMAEGEPGLLGAVDPLFRGLAAEGTRRAKLERFAADNGLAYQSRGFLAIQLKQQFPNLLLISRAQRAGDMTLPIRPDPSQALSLEGDFDNCFTLYCPKDREQEALYVLTPDLMELLVEDVAPFDVEIANNQLFFYARLPFDLLDPLEYERLFGIVQTIGATIARATSAFVGASATEVTPAQADPEQAEPPQADPPQSARHLASEPLGPNYLVSKSRISKYSVGRLVSGFVVVIIFVGVCAAVVRYAIGSIGH